MSDDAPMGDCEVCEDNPAEFMMQVNHFDRATPPPVRYVYMCNDCAWDAFEKGTHEADSGRPRKPANPMKCDQCTWSWVTIGNSKAFIHEKGCPNEDKDWNRDEGKWEDAVEEEDDWGDSPTDREEQGMEDDRSMFADPGGQSALRAGDRIFPCPTCERPNMLTAQDVKLHYQCDICANGEDG